MTDRLSAAALQMELSKQTLDGLALVSAANFDDASFKALMSAAFLVASGEAKAGEDEKCMKAGANPLTTKQAYTAVLTVILEGAKHSAPGSEIAGGLEESKWSAERIKLFVAAYDQKRELIRSQLATQSSFPFPAVTGMSWRMDYYMRSNLLEKVKTPMYFVQINTTNNKGQTGAVPLTMSLEEMNDLLAKCKDMVKQVERVTATK